MEDLPTNIYWVRKKYGENIERLESIDFHLDNNDETVEIQYDTIGSSFHGYTIRCEKLSNLILLPIDTKIYIRHEYDGSRWTYYTDVMTFALVKHDRTHMIETSHLMGGGYVVMNRYIIDNGDQIKFVTKRKIDPLRIRFTNVIKINNN